MKGTCWPRLSTQLDGPRDPGHCQSCGAAGSLDPMALSAGSPSLVAWQEHDGNDQPQPVYVVLCRPCGDRLVDRHPRLYRPCPPWEPMPGVMGLCGSCRHRDGTRCASPAAKANGGEGLVIAFPQPTRVHVLRRGKGARSGWENWYSGPPRGCTGRESIDACSEPALELESDGR